MSLLDEMKQQDQQQDRAAETSAALASLTSRQSAVEAQIAELTAAVNRLIEKQSSDSRALSGRLATMERTPQPQPSDTSGFEPVQKRLDEIEKTLEVLAETLDGASLKTATEALRNEQKTLATAAKRATDAATKATEAAEATKAGAAEVATAGKRALSQAITATEKRADERASAAEDARAARIDKQLAAAARLDDRTMWVGLGHGLAAVATVGVTLAGFWMTLAFAVWGWRWAMNAEGWARGLTFVALIAATAAIISGAYHSWFWLAPRVQVAIDAYDKRNRKK